MTRTPHHSVSNKRGNAVPVLTYFDFPGLAHYVRLLFAIGNVDFVDRRLTREDYAARFKSYTPLGQVPTLEIGDEIICQSSAIALYAASRANLIPECPLMMARALSITSIWDEARTSVFASATAAFSDPEERHAHIRKVWMEGAPKTLELIQAILDTVPPASDSPYLLGKLSLVDVCLASLFENIRVMEGAEKATALSAAHPRIADAVKAVSQLPAVQRVCASYSTPKITLHYFKFDGRQLPIRWALVHAGIPFEEHSWTFEEWPAVKAEAPAGKCPWLTIEDAAGKKETLTESSAILMYVGNKAGLVPRDYAETAHMWSLMQHCEEASILVFRPYEMPEAEKEQYVKNLLAGPLPAAIERVEKSIQLKLSKKGYAVGDKLSIADLKIASFVWFMNMRHNGLVIPDIWTKYPGITRVCERVMTMPEIAKAFQVMTSKPTMHYFDFLARAHGIKLMFEHTKIEHEWKTFTLEEWRSSVKNTSITLKTPYMDVDGARFYEIIGIAKYLAERSNLMPLLIENRCRADALWSCCVGIFNVMYPHSEAPKDVQAHKEEFMPLFLQRFDAFSKLLAVSQSTEGYAVENRLTWIDFLIAGEIEWIKSTTWMEGVDLQTKWPNVHKLQQLVFSLSSAQ